MDQCSRLEGESRDNFPYFSIKTYIVTPHLNRLTEMVLMRGHNIRFVEKKEKLPSDYQMSMFMFS